MEKKNSSKTRRSSSSKKKKSIFPKTCFFECPECATEWFDWDLGENKRNIWQECFSCGFNCNPYLIKDRCYGTFRCRPCKKQWLSAYAYAKTFQKCSTCNLEVFPHVMCPLERRRNNHIRNNKSHLQNLCGRCKKLGTKCCNISVNDIAKQLGSLSL